MRERIYTTIVFGFLLTCILLIGMLWYQKIEKPLEVVFLDVGQGSAAYIRTPSGFEILIDAGETRKTLRNLGVFRSVWDREIDLLIASHPDRDHIGMFPDIIRRFRVGSFLETGKRSNIGAYQTLDTLLSEQDIDRIQLGPGERLVLPDGVVLTILYPYGLEIDKMTDNESSIILRLEYAGFSFLFTGDATAKTELAVANLYPSLIDVDVLLVSHHGSKSSSDPLFIQQVSPRFGVISVGSNNRYGHPHGNTLETLKNWKTQVLRTDQLRNIQFKVFSSGEFDIISR